MAITSIGKTPVSSHAPAKAETDKKLKDACRDFEGIMIQMMLKSMRSTLTGDAVFGDSMGKDIYKSMYDQELANMIAKGDNNLGLGDALYQELTKNKR